jgi:hypothetical protein
VTHHTIAKFADRVLKYDDGWLAVPAVPGFNDGEKETLSRGAFRDLPRYLADRLRSRENVEALENTGCAYVTGEIYQNLLPLPPRPPTAPSAEACPDLIVDVQFYGDDTAIRRAMKRRSKNLLVLQVTILNLGAHRLDAGWWHRIHRMPNAGK